MNGVEIKDGYVKMYASVLTYDEYKRRYSNHSKKREHIKEIERQEFIEKLKQL